MRGWLVLGMLTVVGLLNAASLASAQFAPDAVPPPSGTLPAPQAVPELPPPAVVPVRPLTVSEFVATFKPLPGKYEVLLIHPKTGCPVKVCFTLPPGCLRNVRFTGHRIVFDYKCQCNVVIWFFHSGKVWVRG